LADRSDEEYISKSKHKLENMIYLVAGVAVTCGVVGVLMAGPVMSDMVVVLGQFLSQLGPIGMMLFFLPLLWLIAAASEVEIE
jgi:hypothetical protein